VLVRVVKETGLIEVTGSGRKIIRKPDAVRQISETLHGRSDKLFDFAKHGALPCGGLRQGNLNAGQPARCDPRVILNSALAP
jgi:hypothetical protein